MFQEWLDNKIVPKLAQCSKISLLHKKGSKDNIENYRTLSVCCNIAKLFSIIIYLHLCVIIENSNLLGECQNGFRPKCCATDNLFILKTLHEMAYFKVNKRKVYSAYIDLTKAYDRVNLTFLWYKMEKFGFPTDLIQILQSLYSDTTAVIH